MNSIQCHLLKGFIILCNPSYAYCLLGIALEYLCYVDSKQNITAVYKILHGGIGSCLNGCFVHFKVMGTRGNSLNYT